MEELLFRYRRTQVNLLANASNPHSLQPNKAALCHLGVNDEPTKKMQLSNLCNIAAMYLPQ